MAIIDKGLKINKRKFTKSQILDFPTHYDEILPVKRNYKRRDDASFRVNIGNKINTNTHSTFSLQN